MTEGDYMKLLVIDSCIRGELSSTRRLLNSFLEKFSGEYEVTRLVLTELDLNPMDAAELKKRNDLLSEGKSDDKMFKYAHLIKEADKIIVAAPYWDFSFPSLLKVFFEKTAVTGITFGYTENGSVGYCKADHLVYLSTAGGYIAGAHLGAEYVRNLVGMFGINNVSSYSIEGLDIDPSKREQLLEEGITRILSAAKL